MELLLWRHAEAVEGYPDSARALTAKGHKQAHKVGAWISERLPKHALILASPTRRTQQTAEALDLPFETSDAVGPGASAQDVLRAAAWPDGRRDVLIIGHQPTLGEVASLLLLEEERPISVRKAALWWFASRDREGTAATILRAVIGPELV